MPAVFPFRETARQASKILVDFKRDDLLRAVSPFWATDMPAALSTPMPPDTPVAADLQLSSPGVMDGHLQGVYKCQGEEGAVKVEVQEMWFALDVLSPSLIAGLWTFRGELFIHLSYNEAYHREESIALLLRLIRDQLQQGLGVGLGLDVRAPGEEVYMKRGMTGTNDFLVKSSL